MDINSKLFLILIIFGNLLISNQKSFLKQNELDIREVDYENSNIVKQFIYEESIKLKDPKEYERKSREEWKKLIETKEKTRKDFTFYDILDDRCENREKEGTISDFWYFVPTISAILYKQGESVEFEAKCFKKNKITFLKSTETYAEFKFEASNPKNLLCADYYLFSTSRIHETKTVYFKGSFNFVLKNLNHKDNKEIEVSGMRLLSFCSSPEKELLSLWKTITLFIGGFSPEHGKIPEKTAEANIDFLRRYANLDFPKRTNTSMIKLDKSQIKTGDFFGVTRLDGVDQLIMMGTGSSLGHSTVAVWIDGELYVVESQDGWYWPTHGVQKTKYEDWLKYADNADFNVVVMKLRDDIRKKFNEKKAVEWYKSKEGLNYGYHNFLTSWFDGYHNMPKGLDLEVLVVLFGILDKFTKATYDKIIGEMLNKRVNKEGLSHSDVIYEGALLGLKFEDLLAIPEMEGLKYSDGENYVCSCLVIGLYKAGGLFDDLEIQPQEFSPKDIYQLNFFDINSEKRPDACKKQDPNEPFCQIMGKYRLNFKGLNSFDPYNKMNERCNSESPEFIRNEGC